MSKLFSVLHFHPLLNNLFERHLSIHFFSTSSFLVHIISVFVDSTYHPPWERRNTSEFFNDKKKTRNYFDIKYRGHWTGSCDLLNFINTRGLN